MTGPGLTSLCGRPRCLLVLLGVLRRVGEVQAMYLEPGQLEFEKLISQLIVDCADISLMAVATHAIARL